MTGKIFLDTNLWVYLYDKKPPEKSQKVREIVQANVHSIQVSTQILGEVFNVLTRKKSVSKIEAAEVVLELSDEFPIIAIGTSHVLKAIDISNRYNYSYWDSLIIATAILSDCTTVYSEDMQHNQLIDDKTRVCNPLLI